MIPTRGRSWLTRARPSRETSCSVKAPAPVASERIFPEVETARSERLPPVTAAVNHTSDPSGDHARPEALSKTGVSDVFLPPSSRSAIAPPSSPVTGWSMNAIRSPRGEKRGDAIQPVVS